MHGFLQSGLAINIIPMGQPSVCKHKHHRLMPTQLITLTKTTNPFLPPVTKPIPIENPGGMTVFEGERVNLQPIITGNPFPQDSWYHNRAMVVPDYICCLLSINGKLTIANVEPSHSGTNFNNMDRFHAGTGGGLCTHNKNESCEGVSAIWKVQVWKWLALDNQWQHYIPTPTEASKTSSH